MPALLISMSSDSTWSAAAWICAVLVTSRLRGVTRSCGWGSGRRVPAYTRLAPLARASAASACPMPRLAPVTRTVLSFMVMCVLITRETRRERRRNRSPEPEHGDQARIAEGGDPADSRAGDGEHANAVGLVVPVLVTGKGRRGWLPVGAGGQHPPVTRRSQDLVAQERHTGLPAAEPGAQRGCLYGGAGEQEPLQCRGVGVLERRNVLVEERAGPRRARLGDLAGGRGQFLQPRPGALQRTLDRHRRGSEHHRDLG